LTIVPRRNLIFRNDPLIDARAARSARMFQALFPLAFRLQYSSPAVRFAAKPIARPDRISIPTRHGDVAALVYRPTNADTERQLAAGTRPPVHLITHGGAFIVRVPQQEDNVARYLASEIGAFVVVPADYDTAPKVRFPVAEQQTYDVFRWIHENGDRMGWDSERVSVGGPSAGGKFALNVALQAIDEGGYRPVAVTSEYGVSDISLPDAVRTSPKDSPVVSASLMDLVRRTYFAGADLTDPLASPARHPRLAELPPTLILTAGFDTLRHEMNALANTLRAAGVPVTHREFDGVDHGFTHTKPAAVAGEAIRLIGEHLRAAYAAPQAARQAGRPDPVAVLRRFIDEVVNGGDLSALDELWAADLAWHGGSMGDIHGIEAYRAYLSASAAGAFTGMRLDVKEVITAGDQVVVRFTNSGTQTGPFMGAQPSGRHAEWLGIGIYTVHDGKISEAWFGEDILGMLLQLGAVSLPA
jgi:acetyl esterase